MSSLCFGAGGKHSPVRAIWDAHPCGQDQGGNSGPFPNAFQMPSLNEGGEKKIVEMSEMPTLKERKNERKGTHTSAADLTV